MKMKRSGQTSDRPLQPMNRENGKADGPAKKKETGNISAFGTDLKERPVSRAFSPELDQRRFISRRSAGILLLVFWTPVIMCCLPGNMLWDTFTGIAQFLKINYWTPNIPYFLNFLFGSIAYTGQLLGNINHFVMAYCLLQCGVMIFLLSDSICWIGNRCRIAGYFLLIFYGLVPVFSIYSMSMAKDSCFAAAAVLYVSLSVRALGQSDFWQNDRNTILFSLSILLMTLSRNHSGWIPAAAFVLYAVFVLKRINMILKSVAVLLLVGFFTFLLPGALRIPFTEIREGMSVPLQTMAYYVKTYPEDLSDDEKDIISQVIPVETMIAKYDPDISDPIKNESNFNNDTTGPFIRLWFQKLLKHPDTMVSGFYRGIYIYLSPAEYCKIKPHASIGFDGSQSIKTTLGLNNSNPNLSTLSDYLQGWLNTPVLHLFVKIGLFSIMLLISILLLVVFKQGRYMLCFAPLLMVFIGCLLSPVNGYYRYAYAMIIGVPIAFTDLLLSIICQGKRCISARRESRQRITSSRMGTMK